MQNKKGTSVLNIFLTILIGIFLLGMITTFVVDNADSGDVTIDDSYRNVTSALLEQQNELNTTATDIREAIEDLSEVDENFATGFAGFAKGALSIFQLPINILDTGTKTFGIVANIPGLDVILHPMILSTLTVAVTIIIIFSLMRLITQRGNDA